MRSRRGEREERTGGGGQRRRRREEREEPLAPPTEDKPRPPPRARATGLAPDWLRAGGARRPLAAALGTARGLRGAGMLREPGIAGSLTKMSLPSGNTKHHFSGLHFNSEKDKTAAQGDVYRLLHWCLWARCPATPLSGVTLTNGIFSSTMSSDSSVLLPDHYQDQSSRNSYLSRA